MPAPVHQSVLATLGGWLERRIGRLAFTFNERRVAALTQVLMAHISAGLDHLRHTRAIFESRLDALSSPRAARVLLTNGLFGAYGHQFYRLCRERGIKVVDFEHGVTKGLAALTSARPAFSEAHSTDHFLVSSRNAVRDFADRENESTGFSVVVGLPDHTRRLFRPKLQRFLARRNLGLNRRQPVIMHVSTLPYPGNYRAGGGVPSESTVWKIDCTLIREVYAELPHQIVFKEYPTQRFPHNPSYATLFGRESRIKFLKDEDFRYMRAVADAIVTSNPTSTLGWCVGTDVPLVWIDSRVINPLVDDEMRGRFEASFIVVDGDATDWAERLREILSTDIRSIVHLWQSKSEARSELLSNFIAGPPGSSGRRSAAAVRRIVRLHESDMATKSSRGVSTTMNQGEA